MSSGAGLLQLICTENTDEYLCERKIHLNIVMIK